MPDDGNTIGKMGNLGIEALAQQSQRSLKRFTASTDGIKNVSDRSTLSDTQRADERRAQHEKAATDFEALLLQQMVQSMWKTVPSEGMLSGSNEEAMYRDMLSEQYAQELAKSQSLGLKDAVLGEMIKKDKS